MNIFEILLEYFAYPDFYKKVPKYIFFKNLIFEKIPF